MIEEYVLLRIWIFDYFGRLGMGDDEVHCSGMGICLLFLMGRMLRVFGWLFGLFWLGLFGVIMLLSSLLLCFALFSNIFMLNTYRYLFSLS